MCTFTRPTCSTCHNSVGIGSTNACGLMPEGMAVWFCPEMVWNSEEAVESCRNCPESAPKNEGLRTKVSLLDVLYLNRGSKGRSGEKKDEGAQSSRSSMETKVEEMSDRNKARGSSKISVDTRDEVEVEEAAQSSKSTNNAEVDGNVIKSSRSSVETRVEEDEIKEETQRSRRSLDTNVFSKKKKKKAGLQSSRSNQETKVRSKSSWSTQHTKVEEERLTMTDMYNDSPSINTKTTDERDMEKKGRKLAEPIATAGRKGIVMINGYLVDKKWEKKRQEMTADEKRKWSNPKPRIGCCIVQ